MGKHLGDMDKHNWDMGQMFKDCRPKLIMIRKSKYLDSYHQKFLVQNIGQESSGLLALILFFKRKLL